MRPKFVLFGSSIVQYNHYGEGWGATLAHLYGRKVDIVLRGYAGWNSTRGLQVVDDIFPKISIEQRDQPALAIVYFGGNDSHLPHPSGLGPHVRLEEYIQNMCKIANYLKINSPKTRLIFLSCPPIGDEQTEGNIDAFGKAIRTNEVRKQYSDALLNMCSHMNIKAIDLWSLIQRRDDWKEVCFIDGIHFSAEGSEMVSKEIIKVIKEAEWEPSLYWKTMPVEFGEDSPFDPIHPLDPTKTINISNIPFPHGEDWEWE